MAHPELELERARLQFARKCLDEMRVRTATMADRDELLAATEADVEAVRHQLRLRVRSLQVDAATLSFGRIDEEHATDPEHGPTWYVGRRHVEDPDGDPVVVDWRAPVAVPFYRATGADPLGLARRRRFTFVADELADIYEEDFTDPDSLAGATGVPDPLLAELRRERTGQMRDIVATIQAEQDEVIRAPLGECLIVQGGPGTGKTAVGLHRAAFILYEHRDALARDGVLVVGPNLVFLDYIAQVLPSLGETSVTQSTLAGLFGLRFRLGIGDAEERVALLGDPRWVRAIGAACDEAIAAAGDLTVRFRHRRVVVPAAVVAELVAQARARDTARRMQREWCRARLLRDAYERWTGGELVATSLDEFVADVMTHKDSRSALDGVWRSVNATAIARSLLTSRAALARTGAFADDEVALVVRRRARQGRAELWSEAELPILDEAEAQITGEIRRFGHVVVDEAQDYSPMALRMIGRRAARGSMTVLGDLAQTTGVAGATDWDGALAHLGDVESPRRVELTIGYRLPRPILDHANRLLAEAAPHVTPARSARDEGDPPEVLVADDVVAKAAARAAELRSEFVTTALIANPDRHDALHVALAEVGVDLVDATIAQPLTLLTPELAKGLEFDAVVVCDPDAIKARRPHGARLLYVALTRAVQHLTIVGRRAHEVA
jgi:DNA helicase IV